uniref:Glycosyltransferase family 92 protein n=1 Tax=Caenorhabditis japonica TaxID=281687 RepID=A0A8R1I9Q3_CAEJA
MALLLTVIIITLLIAFHHFEIVKLSEPTSRGQLDSEYVEIDTVRPQDPLDYTPCRVEPWNNVTLEEISFKDVRADWRNKSMGTWNNFKDAALRPISAFVYEHEIVVVTAKYIKFEYVYAYRVTKDYGNFYPTRRFISVTVRDIALHGLKSVSNCAKHHQQLFP